MAHFAKVVEGIVEQVIVAEQDFIDSIEGSWIQTSYNTHKNIHYGEDGEPDGGTALRKNFAGVGYNYDATDDFFYSQQFFTSWILDRTTGVWEAPVPYPDEGVHTWDEEAGEWVSFE
tara:strand:+ start:247 stop:597 length:351 start_codon:yes stop_codon:yes gene_type:complete